MNAHLKAITLAPRLDYKTISKVDGPLVVLDDVSFPK
jgi:hypothetical protein